MNVILVHGFLGNALNWLPIKQRLERKQANGEIPAINVVAVDLLGHGKKSRQPEVGELNLISIAAGLRDEIPVGDFIAVGHSFGVRPWLTLLRDAEVAARCRCFVVEDSSPVISEAGYEDLKKIFRDVELPQEDRVGAKAAVEKVFGSDSKMSRFLMTNLAAESSGRYDWRFDARKLEALLEESRRSDLWQVWQDLSVPIEMIMGARSDFVPRARVEECMLRRGNRATRATWIEGAGHWVHADQADLFTDKLADLIKMFA